jgi:hypothetical protein
MLWKNLEIPGPTGSGLARRTLSLGLMLRDLTLNVRQYTLPLDRKMAMNLGEVLLP